jgi:glycosyltransferase involved in cell wall biosynthesis
VIRSFGSRVRLIEQENQGPGAARNAGFAASTGEYIQFMDSDDLSSLNKLQAQADLLDKTGADVAFGPWAHVVISGQNLAFQTCVLQQALPPDTISLPGWMLRGWFTIFQSLLFRRSFLMRAGGYVTDAWYGEDMEFFFRLLSRTPRVAFAADTLTLYRVNSANNLSSDAGASKHRRVVDWARCLERIGRQAQESKQTVDGLSRAIFLAGVRKHLRYLHAVPEAPKDLIRELSNQVSQISVTYLAALELWMRLTEHLRLMRTGQRWMAGLQAAPATAQQIKLIQDLGFDVEQKNS